MWLSRYEIWEPASTRDAEHVQILAILVRSTQNYQDLPYKITKIYVRSSQKAKAKAKGEGGATGWWGRRGSGCAMCPVARRSPRSAGEAAANSRTGPVSRERQRVVILVRNKGHSQLAQGYHVVILVRKGGEGRAATGHHIDGSGRLSTAMLRPFCPRVCEAKGGGVSCFSD